MSSIFLPLHVWDREFDSRLVLAILLASRGKTVFIGHEYNMVPLYGKENCQAIFRAGGAVNNYRGVWDKIVTEKEGIAVTQDEEGINKVPLSFIQDKSTERTYASLNKNDIDSYLNHSSIDAVSATTAQLSWGKIHKEFLAEIYTQQEARQYAKEKQIIERSSIRFDILGGIGELINNKTINSLNKIFKTFVLVVDNFTIDQGRHGQGLHDPSGDMRAEGRTEEEINYLLERIKAERELEIRARESFSKLVLKLTENFPHVQFIIRPHPVHPREYWHRTFAEQNIDILASGCVHPWLYAAACTIHSGCTTGLEAFAANTKNFDVSELIDERPRYVTTQLFTTPNKNPRPLRTHVRSVRSDKSS